MCIYCGDDPIIKINCYCREILPPLHRYDPSSIFEEIRKAKAEGDDIKLMYLKIKLNSCY